MKKVPQFVAALALSAMVAVPLPASSLETQPRIKSEVVMKEGGTVHLFHSGTPDVKKEICLNDVIPVYRETMAGGHTTSKEVGKIKVDSYVGEHYFSATVVEGTIKMGDIAKKGTASCLIQPAP